MVEIKLLLQLRTTMFVDAFVFLSVTTSNILLHFIVKISSISSTSVCQVCINTASY